MERAESTLSSTTRMRRRGITESVESPASGMAGHIRRAGGRECGQPDDELAPLAEARRSCAVIAAAVHRRPGLRTRPRPIPSPPCERSDASLGLNEKVEDPAAASPARCRCPCPAPEDRLVPLPPRRSGRSGRPARCTWRRWSAGCQMTCSSRVGSASSTDRLRRAGITVSWWPFAPSIAGRAGLDRPLAPPSPVHRLQAEFDLAPC